MRHPRCAGVAERRHEARAAGGARERGGHEPGRLTGGPNGRQRSRAERRRQSHHGYTGDAKASPMAPEDAPPPEEGIGADDGDDQFTPLGYDIIVSPVDYPLESLHRMMAEYKIVMPSFQRQYVWDRPRASRLIESFIMDLPVPPVFVSEQKDGRLLVIDGRQRLETVHRFFKEEFREARNGKGAEKFRLVGINPEGPLSNKAFSDLDPVSQRLLRNTVLRVVVIRQMEPDKNPAAMHHIFERLNTGGMRMTGQEVRNCMYAGRLNDLLNDLNGIGEWRGLLGMPHRDRRQRDVELILRYMALFHSAAEYKSPMKDFLSSYMAKNRDPSDEFAFEERTRFVRTCTLLSEALGEHPLKQRGRINPSVFDSLFVTIAANHGACGGGGLARRVERLRSDERFIDATTRATTDAATVARRMGLARDVLCGGSP